MQFNLLYSGPLHSTGNRGGAVDEKFAIRRTVHAQLSRLWSTNPNLMRMADMIGRRDYAEEINREHIPDPPALQVSDAIMRGLTTMGRNWSRHGFNYVPLVTADLCLRCALDILFLRVEERDYVLRGGDIDGRLKTLFDGLRMAREANELPAGTVQGGDEDPMFVLLENDDLISEVNIDAGQLLRLPQEKPLDEHDVYLQITVRLNPVQQTQYSWVF